MDQTKRMAEFMKNRMRESLRLRVLVEPSLAILLICYMDSYILGI